MKKGFTFILAVLLALFSGCSPKEKITVIKGPGSANNNLMVSLNQLCPGSVEGFSGRNLIISRNNGNKIEFYTVNIDSADEAKLLSAIRYKDYYLNISRDGKKFLYNNYLVDVQNKSSVLLHENKINVPQKPDGFPDIADYSFAKNSDLIYVNPIYYIYKYYNKKIPGLNDLSGMILPDSNLKTGDLKGNTGEFGFNNVKVPDIDFIKNGELLIDQLKYVFIGHKKGTLDTPLYAFDIFEKKFQLIDSNVESYRMAPDNKSVVFIRKNSGEKSEKKLIMASTDGKIIKELKTLQEITGYAWSGDGNWVVYSGSERNKNDIYIIKSDGSAEEQLTQGINSTGKAAWSKWGDEIAFTSTSDGLDAKQTVYLIKMNLNTVEKTVEPERDAARTELAEKLNWIIEMETDTNEKNSKNQ